MLGVLILNVYELCEQRLKQTLEKRVHSDKRPCWLAICFATCVGNGRAVVNTAADGPGRQTLHVALGA
jgi:hypothetical protein